MLVFDVLGSLLDEDQGQRRAADAVLNLSAQATDEFVAAWSSRVEHLMRSVRRDGERYRTSETLHRQAIVKSADELRIPLPDEVATELSMFGRTLEPFPDVPAALVDLARRHPLVALTNAGSAQAFSMSSHAGLRWSYLVSGEVVQAFKPDPRMYDHAIRALDLVPGDCVFVAAHPWDLAAAAEHGFRTALLDRAGVGGTFDFVAPDLGALVPMLG